jgi:predicted ArsR family transcriptional regulator
MTVKEKEPDRGRGKPLGTRAIKDLHERIMVLLKQDKDDKGDGMTAFAISKQLIVPDPTVRLYLGDLVEKRHVTTKKILKMTLYRFNKPLPLKE